MHNYTLARLDVILLAIANLELVQRLSDMLGQMLVLLMLLLVEVIILLTSGLVGLLRLSVDRVHRLSVALVRPDRLDRSSSLELGGLLLSSGKVVIVIQKVLSSSARGLGVRGIRQDTPTS